MKRMLSHQRRRRGEERGVILLITALIIFAFFMVAALALDFSQMSANVEQGTQTAKFAALTALQAYSTSSKDLSRSERLTQALAQANSVTGQNLLMTMGGKATGDTISMTQADVAPGNVPILIAGKYYSEAPESYCSNPCTSGDSPPCFVPLNGVKLSCEPPGTTSGSVQPNSFRMLGRYYSDLRTIFARLMGSNKYSVAVDVISAFTPRRGMFLVDISLSTYRQTHWYTKTSPEYPSYYSYYLAADNGSSNTFYDSGGGSWPTLSPNRAQYPALPAGAPGTGAPEFQTLHYQSDYAVVYSGAPPGAAPSPYTGKTASMMQMVTDADYNSNPDYSKHHPNPVPQETPYPPGVDYSASQHAGTFRVDTFRNSSYGGPEPFMTIFSGLNGAVDAFKERAVTGDRLGIVFFDHVLTWPRVISLTSDFDYIKKFTDVSVTNDPNRGLQLVLKHGIFPHKGSMSNLLAASNEAMRQFNENQTAGTSSVDFMVYFGDGLVNCVQNPAALCIGQPGCTAEACTEGYNHYRRAMNELRHFALYTLFPRRISMNVVLVGSHVGPHTLALGDSHGNCMTYTDARNAELEFTQGLNFASGDQSAWSNAYENMSAAAPFYEAVEDMYRISRITGGIFGPIRPYSNSPSLYAPSCTDTNPPRIMYSHYSSTADVDRYIKEEIMESNPYMIVPGKPYGSSGSS